MTDALVPAEMERALMAPPSPRQIIQQATEEANVLAEVIENRKLYSSIQGRKFVKCEGWVTLATLRGCLPREVSVTEEAEGRYVAVVELCRISDGAVLSRASAECGGPQDDVWQRRPPNARRSMAVTRATGKACRIAFSWVMALAGFDPTPLEEMPETSAKPKVVRPKPAPPKYEPSSEPGVWRGKIIEHAQGEDPNGKWKRYDYFGEGGIKFSTFSDTIGGELLGVDYVEFHYTSTPKGNRIDSFKDLQES